MIEYYKCSSLGINNYYPKVNKQFDVESPCGIPRKMIYKFAGVFLHICFSFQDGTRRMIEDTDPERLGTKTCSGKCYLILQEVSGKHQILVIHQTLMNPNQILGLIEIGSTNDTRFFCPISHSTRFVPWSRFMINVVWPWPFLDEMENP